jgi:EAL domain-containing protein (putative c-di-GMP-specific phosphodiesterase class I)
VCNQIRAWRDQEVTPPVIAISLSGAQFKLATDIGRTVADAIARAGIGPEQLELELTETVLMETAQKHNEALTQLQRLGVRLAIDDFGTGYSSLDYLRSFQPSRLKIDRRFVGDMTTSTDDAAIVRAIIGLAGELGIEVVAEGVETAGERAFLLSAGCQLAQGNYFSAPVPLQTATEMLRQHPQLLRGHGQSWISETQATSSGSFARSSSLSSVAPSEGVRHAPGGEIRRLNRVSTKAISAPENPRKICCKTGDYAPSVYAVRSPYFVSNKHHRSKNSEDGSRSALPSPAARDAQILGGESG